MKTVALSSTEVLRFGGKKINKGSTIAAVSLVLLPVVASLVHSPVKAQQNTVSIETQREKSFPNQEKNAKFIEEHSKDKEIPKDFAKVAVATIAGGIASIPIAGGLMRLGRWLKKRLG